MEKKQGKKQFLLRPKAESCTAIIFALGLAIVLKRIIPFEWYLPSSFTELVNMMLNIVVMTSSVISGILFCIMEVCSAQLLACSLIAAFLIAILYFSGLLHNICLKK